MNPSDALREALERIAAMTDIDPIINACEARDIARAALAAPVSVADVIEGPARYCDSCDCDLCRVQQKARDLGEAVNVAKTEGARCWSCSCGWVRCYTPAEVEEYGEPPECGDCYRERLVEQEPAAIAALRSQVVDQKGSQ